MAEDAASGGEAAKMPQDAAPKTEPKDELRTVESPPLSPAGEAPSPVPELIPEPIIPPAGQGDAANLRPCFRIRLRHKYLAVLAGSVTIAAALGIIVGTLIVGSRNVPLPDAASLNRQQAMQRSIGRLDKEVAALKASVVSESKSARSQIAKTSDKITDRLRSAPEVTGSIPTPPAAVPTPIPRPAVRMAAAESRVVPDWTIHDVRGGYVYVRGHGDIYQVVPGAPLPGLGPVQEITRRGGRWVVVTPRGLIVSLRDRRYFETN